MMESGARGLLGPGCGMFSLFHYIRSVAPMHFRFFKFRRDLSACFCHSWFFLLGWFLG